MMTRVCFTSMPLVVAIATCRGDLYQGGWGEEKPNWDGVGNNLPTMGGYVGSSDWDLSGTASLHSTRKLARSAGDMAKANGGVL